MKALLLVVMGLLLFENVSAKEQEIAPEIIHFMKRYAAAIADSEQSSYWPGETVCRYAADAHARSRALANEHTDFNDLGVVINFFYFREPEKSMCLIVRIEAQREFGLLDETLESCGFRISNNSNNRTRYRIVTYTSR